MPAITPEAIRDMAVKTVEGFLNEKTPLSEGIAKQASENQLNSEQIKRVVEASNMITYLKVASMTDDKTFEFPVADYNDVMSLIAIPDVIKQAGTLDQFNAGVAPMSPLQPGQTGTNAADKTTVPFRDPSITGGVEGDEGNPIESHVDTKYSASPSEINDPFDEQEKLAYFRMEKAKNDRRVEDLRDIGESLSADMYKLAQKMSKDPEILDKMATVMNDDNYKILSTLVTGAPQVKRDLQGVCFYKQASLQDSRKLSDMYDEARELLRELAYREGLQKRAGVIDGVTRTLGRVIGGVVSKPLKPVSNAAKNLVTVAKNTGATLGQNAMGKADSMISGSEFKAKPIEIPGSVKRTATMAGSATMAGLDASMYTPSVDKATGNSSNVWDALQG